MDDLILNQLALAFVAESMRWRVGADKLTKTHHLMRDGNFTAEFTDPEAAAHALYNARYVEGMKAVLTALANADLGSGVDPDSLRIFRDILTKIVNGDTT